MKPFDGVFFLVRIDANGFMLSWDKFYVVTWLALLNQKLCGTECNAGQIISTDRSIQTQHGNRSLINRCSNVFNFGFASIFQWFSLDSNV